MSFTSSDPIQSLLATLRSVQDGAASSSGSPVPPAGLSSSAPSISNHHSQPQGPTSHRYAPAPLPADEEYDPSQPLLRPPPPPQLYAPPTPRHRLPKEKVDLKGLSFPQSLPYLAQLAEDDEFVAKLEKMKKEQDELEQSLWREREALIKAGRENVDRAKKVALVSGKKELTPFEQKALVTKLEQSLQRFHTGRLLPAWDSLLRRQQAALESLGVPTMGLGGDRDRQRRVVAALEGMVGED